MNLNNLLIGLENHQQQKSTSLTNNQTPTNRLNDDILNQLNDFNNNNSNLSNNFVNLLQSNDSSSTKTAIKPIKERTASGDGQFICTICQRSYRHKHSLQRHLISHRNQENNNSSSNNNQQSNKTNQDQVNTKSAFKTELSNESNNNNTSNLFTQSTNSATTPSSFLNNRSSSVDSVKSGEHNLKQQQQMFSQEILESLISGSNSSILNNLISGNVHSPSNNPTSYSNSPATDTATSANSTTAMFTV